MARARNIKPGFFRNAELVDLPAETRLLFIGLWTLADREGRLEDRPKQIKMELFPADSFDVGSMLTDLQSSKFINRYEVDGSKFIEVVNFIKHQDPHYKEKASDIPPPPGQENFIKATGVTRTQRARILERDGYKCQCCEATEGLCIDHIMPVSRGGDSSDENLQVLCSACNTKKGNKIDGEQKNTKQRRINIDPNLNQGNCSSPSDSLIPDSLIPDSLIPDSLQEQVSLDQPENKKQTATATRLPADWMPSSDDIDFCEKERVDLAPFDVADRFRDYWIAQPGAKGRKLDWPATWRNWVRNEKRQPSSVSFSDKRQERDSAFLSAIGMSAPQRSEKLITGDVV